MKPHCVGMSERLGLIQLAFLLILQTADGGSATWNLKLTSNDWNTAANWTPASVPNGSRCGRDFADSNVTGVSLSTDTTVDSILFAADASAFEVTANPAQTFTISGASLMNSSTLVQKFDTAVDKLGNSGTITFSRAPTLTGPLLFTNGGATAYAAAGGETRFDDLANAGTGAFINKGNTSGTAGGGRTTFYGNSNAGYGTFTTSRASASVVATPSSRILRALAMAPL